MVIYRINKIGCALINKVLNISENSTKILILDARSRKLRIKIIKWWLIMEVVLQKIYKERNIVQYGKLMDILLLIF